MKVLIDIPEEAYKIIVSHAKDYRLDTIEDYIVKGEPIYNNPTNGDIIQALFPKETIIEQGAVCTYIGSMRFDTEWWNAKYKGNKE